jgi:bifunctional non-homologous end joining protein LigD
MAAVLRPSPFIIPAQPSLRDRPPKGDGWLHEVKFDGYRAQLHKAGNSAIVYSKNGREFSNRFPGILHALLALPSKNAIIDAEVVALKDDGSADFRALHSGNYTQENLCAWCFDLLAFNDTDMRPLPLVARKLKLGTLLKRYNHGSLRYSEGFRDPERLLTECRRLGLEGIVSKKKDAPYRSGKCDWLKIKCAQWKEENKDRAEMFGQGRT